MSPTDTLRRSRPREEGGRGAYRADILLPVDPVVAVPAGLTDAQAAALAELPAVTDGGSRGRFVLRFD